MPENYFPLSTNVQPVFDIIVYYATQAAHSYIHN